MDFQRFEDLELVDFPLAGELYSFNTETRSGEQRIGNDPTVPPYDYSITNC
ncbi:hypothetical protein [uncultured Roseibium sp.]|uniref:hypothetical protein n=1 Tax=uncultured Roseibium sp. TaxID=1936171 RepID=UPI002612BFC4|nr:hypothetical protein [uncultured Roseibium sp.]